MASLIRVMLLLLFIGVSNAQLSSNFYSNSCPLFPLAVRTQVLEALVRDARMGASLLRLHYVDCFVNGCDASVLLDDTVNFTGEKKADLNANSLRGFDVIDKIKAAVESICPGVVSCADILAVAARDGTVMLGGPSWEVRLGRRDSTTASLAVANKEIPAPTFNLDELIASFANKGFSPRELVALSGAHTIGQARCASFRTRIYNETNINVPFATVMRGRCPQTAGNNTLSPLDSTTPNFFDNAYFRNLISERGLLHSDQQLFNGGSTDAYVNAYFSNSLLFFSDFANAMVKMSEISPLTGANGQIRMNCRSVN